MEVLQEVKNLKKERQVFVQRADKTVFGLSKTYRQIIDGKQIDVYNYKDYTQNLKGCIKTDLNLERMQVNTEYRDIIINNLLNSKWIAQSIQKRDGYIGSPEEVYKTNLKMKREAQNFGKADGFSR